LLLGSALLVFYAVPLVWLVATQSPRAVLVRVRTPPVLTATANSLLTASITTVVATLFGVPLAYWLARTDAWYRAGVTALVVLPLVLPPTVSGIVLLSVVGSSTPLGSVAAALGVPLTRSLAGIVLAQTFVASPFVVVTAKAAFDGVNEDLEYASRSLGTPHRATFRRVTLPLAWPGIVAGMTLTFARAVGEFGATLMLAYYPRTLPVQIWIGFLEQGVERAYPVAFILLVVAVGVLVVLGLVGTRPWSQ
jgi:molybdate/tungstate transport system permease protein